MNVQTDPARLKKSLQPMPAKADVPIRSNFLHDSNLRKLGEALAKGELTHVDGPGSFDFNQRIKENGEKIHAVYLAMNEAQARGRDVRTRALVELLQPCRFLS